MQVTLLVEPALYHLFGNFVTPYNKYYELQPKHNTFKMKVVVVNSSDAIGGAAIACKRLFNALTNSGINTRLLVQEKKYAQNNIINASSNYFQKKINFLLFSIEYIFFNKIIKSPSAESSFSSAWFGIDISNKKEIKEADIINLHWINNSFLNLKSLNKLFELNKPIVWHLHDMWSFTGGCHYSGTCNYFINKCGNCYYLRGPYENDLSRTTWETKATYYKNSNLTIVTPSHWLADLAKQSSLLKSFAIHVIPNPIDTGIFKPIDKKEVKQKLGLDVNKKYLLFAAMNTKHKRKGFDCLKESLSLYKKKNPLTTNIELLIVGKYNENIKIEFDFKIHQLGIITDENKMVAVYNAAEAFLIPSLEDNLPNTVMESMACGIPVVGFKTGGIPEMVDHLKNGYIAEYGSTEDLTKGISWILSYDNLSSLSLNAREKVINNYTYELVAKKYIDLYTKLLPKNY